MRIALIGPAPPTYGGLSAGGVATHQVQLAEGLAQAGVYAPLLATNTSVPIRAWDAPLPEAAFPIYRMVRPGWTCRDYLTTVGIGRVARYAIRLLSRGEAAGSRREILGNVLWYRRFLGAVRPHVVHVQHPLERCLYTRLVLRLEQWNLPVVVTAHSLFGEHSELTIESIMAPNLCAAERVIAVSPHVADQAIDLGVQAERVRLIRSGVDTRRFAIRDRAVARRALGVTDGVRMLLFVGNLEPRKQLDVLLHALAHVRSSVPAAQLAVVGSGQNVGAEDQTPHLLALARRLDLDAVVHFAGRVTDEQLMNYYAAADVFVLPSSSEAQGIVALEAMACGLPVVASAVGGLLGTIDDGQTGFLVPPGEVAALAGRLVAVLHDARLRQRIGAAARRRVERDFSWSASVAATRQVYREIVGDALA